MIPADLLERFRVLSLERVGRVEATWNRLVHVRGDGGGLVREMQREIHTIKGDASVIGWREVRELCQKLEDLLEISEELGFEISEDLELVVTMAIQLVGMLLRVKPGVTTGLDLVGFVRQVDDLLRETRTLPIAQRRRRASGRWGSADAAMDRLAEPTRQRMAAAATSVFVEYMSARGTSSRARLRSAWTDLRDALARTHDTELAPQLERHLASARELAASLDKDVDCTLAIADVRIETRVAEAIDVAVLHFIRNAIDHGIEARGERGEKRQRGSLTVTASQRGTDLEIAVADDGRGIDAEALRARAIAHGFDRPADDLDLVFEPGLSTKASATELSGRGVGMDAAKSAIERVGGKLRIATSPAGTTVTIVVRALVRHISAYQFLAPGGAVSIAVSARWTPVVEAPRAVDSIDPLHAIQLFGKTRQTDVGPPTPLRDQSIRLRWGFLEVSLGAATDPRLVTGERVCPTADDHPLEVIVVDGVETLLLRPEHIADLAAAWERPIRAAAHGVARALAPVTPH
jgi:chemotaxis protein histidine kinase CheA